MRWPWQRESATPATTTMTEHAAQQNARVEQAQGLIDEARTHSDTELGRAQTILNDVRHSEKLLAMYDDAERERRGA